MTSNALPRAYTTSTQYTGTTTFPANDSRRYFFIVMISGSASIEFGGGGGQIPLAEGEHYNPRVAPLSEIVVTTSGTFVVHQG